MMLEKLSVRSLQSAGISCFDHLLQTSVQYSEQVQVVCHMINYIKVYSTVCRYMLCAVCSYELFWSHNIYIGHVFHGDIWTNI